MSPLLFIRGDGGIMDNTVQEGAGAVLRSERPVGFWGGRGALFKILLVNTLLNIVTLGFYRFWARTRLRQFFWSSVEIDGDPIEYTGRGLELFIGFLIVLGVLTPLFIGFSIISVFVGASNPVVGNIMSILFFAVILWLARYAYFRARRYRLARTLWRGIRAGQDGAASVYAWRWFGYAILSVITLGWAVPWMTASLQQYEVDNARFGTANFSYRGNGKDLLRFWWPVPALWLALTVVLAVAIGTHWVELAAVIDSAELYEDGLWTWDAGAVPNFDPRWVIASFFLVYILTAVFYVVYRIRSFRYMLNASSLSDVQISSHFSGWRIVGYGVLLLLAFAVLFAIFSHAIGFVFGFLSGLHLLEAGIIGGAFLPLILVFLFLLVAPMIQFLLFHFPVIRHVVTTLEMTNIDSLDRIVQSSKESPRFGEGLADALDVDVGGF